MFSKALFTKSKLAKILGIGAAAALSSAAVFAEPPIQPGDTLDSLSKAKVVTTVNGQPGSLQELISSGKIQPLSAPAAAPAEAALPNENAPAPDAAAEPAPGSAEAPSQALDAEPADASAEALPELPSSAEAPVNLEQPPAADAPIQASPEAPELQEPAAQ